MAKCKGCGAEIPEGTEYCEECFGKLNTVKDSESYLDSLLNAVMTEEPERREIVYPKRKASSLVSAPENKEPVVALEEDFEVPEAEEQVSPSMEEAFDIFFDGNEELPDLKSYNIFEEVDESTVNRMLAEDLGEVAEDAEYDLEKEWQSEESDEIEETAETDGEIESDEPGAVFDEGDLFAEFGGISEVFEASSEEQTEPEEQEEEVPLSEVGNIEDLFGMLEDARGEEAPEDIVMGEPEVISAAEFDFAEDTFSGIVEEPEEAVPITEYNDFSDLFGGEALTEEEAQAEASVAEQAMDDFADLFAGFEGDGSDLFEFGAEPEELEVPEEQPEETKETVTASFAAEPEVPGTKKAKKKKEKKEPGRFAALYHKLFDDVQLDPSQIKRPPTKEELEAQKKAKQEKKERAKEEKEALLAEKKSQKKQIKQEKQRVAREEKAEKRAKKLEEAKLLLEEMERTRINRAGASIVFIFFAMIAVVIVVGTGIFSYSLSIKNAEFDFNNAEYTLAYNEIYGLKVKEKDVMLYDRIMTVMYVQKQLNSYENYYGMNDKPRALDSLLKGLQRYEKYIELAVDLDVDTDLDSVRKKILEKVSNVFLLTEQEAMEIIQSDNQAEYSKKVYDAAERAENEVGE